MKRLLTIVIACVMLACSALTLTACKKDEARLSVTVEVYNIEEETTEEKTVNFTLYKKLAPKAIAKITELVNDGYYNDAVFYKNNKYSDLQIMLGEYDYKDGKLSLKERQYIPDAEFKQNGVTGSNLTNEEGALGLWKSWDSRNFYYDDGEDKTYSAFYMCTTTNFDFDGYFCLLGKITDDESLDNFKMIGKVLSNADYYESYTTYYTLSDGEFTWHALKTSEYEESKDELDVYTKDDDDGKGTNSQYYPSEIYFATENVKIKSITVGKQK